MSRSSDRSGSSERVGELVSIFLRGKLWWANFQHEGRQQRKSLKTRNKKEARKRAAALDVSLQTGEYGKGSHQPGSIADGIAEYLKYLETEGRAHRTLTKYRRVLAFTESLAGELRLTTLDEIDLRFIDAYRHRLVNNGKAPKTVFSETMIVRQLINFALSRKHLRTDPLASLKLKKPKTPPQPCWSPNEVARILASASEPQRSILTVLADTGTRVGEIKYLTWDDIDFDKNVLHIQPKQGWKPKTGDRRAIPMTGRVRSIFEQRSCSRQSTWVFTASPSRRYPEGGQQLSERRLLDYLKRRLERLGLKGHLHTFRHSFISHAIATGIPEAVVRDIVGHVDQDILKHYTHIADNRKQAAIQKFAESLSELSSVDKDEPGSSIVEEDENDECD
jgi:site-specific recombinase XerD